ncbi:Protein phosphatase 1 regulatory subunit 3A [Channa argus]|uniref:Protein phosphatase 1 regulatory subunit 3A n=1 Tax=Channa argus TaxID=215402 RepID=A0A6G1QQP2_CHAAH|nr:Protein phosphatase 1 regulatory subunit 3A [Channa argus]
MEALYIQPLEEDGIMMEEEEEQQHSGDQENGAIEAPSPMGSTDEETDEDSEPEPPPVVRRKVSFADAFGLNLVSVKEFDNVEVTESEVIQPPEGEETHPFEEFYISCLFTVPSTPEELDQRLQAQMIELESIELLPGTTTLRGIIRVVNLCYTKFVYARVTLDHWNSSFDLLAEYVPGSSDRKTDRFSFKYTLVPPFRKDGTRLEFCLRYETSVGTFWANNMEMNYVLFCHQKGQVKEYGPQVLEESYRSKRSCLRANRRGSTEEKIKDTNNTATVPAEEGGRKTVESDEIQSILHCEEHILLVDSIKKNHRATRLARVHDYLSQRKQQIPKAYSPDSADGQKVLPPSETLWGDAANMLYKRQKKQSHESSQVLTYHQIPLLTLDWKDNKSQRWGTADVDDIWTGEAKMTLAKTSEENIDNSPPANDMWETFLNGTDETADKGTSVCDVWQAFLNGPSCKDHSGVPESEWLQTAASVSPSIDREPQTPHAASSQEFREFQERTDTPTTLHAHTTAACHPLSDTCETLSANVALNTEDQQPAETCGRSLRDENAVTQDASQRSQTNSVTDTLQEFSLKGATPVSEGSVDSSTKCHKRTSWEREREGIMGEAEGIGGDEPFTPCIADLVTSSGESKTTDMTAMPESQNAGTVDRISQGARLDEGLSSSEGGEVTGTAHNAMDDMLAFRETIRQGTKDGERFVFSTSAQGVEERITMNSTKNKVSREEEIFRPLKTEKCEMSQRYANEKECEEFGLILKSKNPLQAYEMNHTQSHVDEFSPKETCEEFFRQSQVMGSELNLNDLKTKKNDMERFRQTEMETSYCTTSQGTKRIIGAKPENTSIFDKDIKQQNDKALDVNSPVSQGPNISVISKYLCTKIQKEDLTQAELNAVLKYETGEHVYVSNRTEEGKSLSCSGITGEQQEANPSSHSIHTVESSDRNKVPSPTDKCVPNPVEEMEWRWAHSQNIIKGQREAEGSEIASDEIVVKGNVGHKDTSTKLHHQPETLERIEEDMRQRDHDERVSVGKLTIEARGELMGNVDDPLGERKNAAAQLEEPSAEVERYQHVEYTKWAEGTKDPITTENTVALDVIESGLEKRVIERFGEDLVRGIFEEVLSGRERDCERDTNIVDGTRGRLADRPDITHDCHLLFEKDFNEAFDSGVFSLTELPTDPSLTPRQGPGQTIVINSDGYSPKNHSQSLTTTDQAQVLSELQSDFTLSAHLSQDLATALATPSGQLLATSAQTFSSPKDQGDCSQIRKRSDSHQERRRQIEDCEVNQKESFNRSAHPSHKHLGSSSEKLKESDGLIWLSILYILSHITRLLIGAVLVAGFFVVVFLCDFPAFFAFYILSLCWWFYKRKRCQTTTNKEMTG